MCQPEANNLLGYASCWIQLAAPMVLQAVGSINLHAGGSVNVMYFTIYLNWGAKTPPFELDGNIYHIDTPSSMQVVGSNSLLHCWCRNLLEPTTCIPKQVVGFRLTHLNQAVRRRSAVVLRILSGAEKKGI